MRQRGIRPEHIENVVKYGAPVQELGRGRNGGRRQKFSKTAGGRTIVAVAEIKANHCWLITAFYAD